MANAITIKELQDASLDAGTLEEYSNEDKMVTARLGLEYPSAPMQARVNTEKGLLPATAFSTKAKMIASSLPNDSYAVVTQDPVAENNGNYQNFSGSWVYLKWNPNAQSKIYTDATVGASSIEAKEQAVADSKDYTDAELKTAMNKSSGTFDTFDLLQSSSLVNDSYALVANDTTNENGHYQKLAGEWTKVKYDPINEAIKKDATNLQNTLAIVGEQPFSMLDTSSNTTTGFYTPAGEWQPHDSFDTSGFIPVKEGDNLLVHYVNSEPTAYSRVTYFSPSKESPEVLSYTSNTGLEEFTEDNRVILDAHKNEEKRNQNVGVIIPKDGFVKITKLNTTVNAEGDDSEFFAAIVSQEALVESTFSHIVPKELINELNGSWFTAGGDAALANNGSLIMSSIAVGEKQTYINEILLRKSNLISKAYPVKKAQFVHIMGTVYGRNIVANIVDGDNIVIQNVDVVSPFSAFNTANTNPVGYFNIKVEQDGFLRVAIGKQVNSLNLVSISDEAVPDLKSYYPYAIAGNKLTPYESLSPPLWSNMSFFQQYGRDKTITAGEELDYSLATKTGSLTKGNLPVLLKKGDVLKFSSKSVSPVYGRAFTVGKPIVGGTSRVLVDPAKTPLSQEVSDNYLAWMNGGDIPTWLGETQETTNYICNEEYDLLVYLFTGNPTAETEYGTSSLGDIEVMSIPEYIEIRNKALKDGIALNKGNTKNDYTQTTAYSNTFLAFKGEVVKTYPGNAEFIVSPTTTYARNRAYEDIKAYSGGEGVIGFGAGAGATYEDYVKNDASHAIKINLASIVSLGVNLFDKIEDEYIERKGAVTKNTKLIASITHFSEDKIGDKLATTRMTREEVELKGEGDEQYVTFLSGSLGNVDTKYGYVKQGKFYKVTAMALRVVYFLPFAGIVGKKANIKTLLPMAFTVSTKGQYIFTPPEDGIVMWEGLTGSRLGRGSDPFENIPDDKWYQRKYYEQELYEVSEQDYLDFTVTYPHEFLDLPNDGTVNLNFISRISEGLKVDIEGVMEIRVGSDVLATVKVTTANQGQSSASAAKSNINIEFLTQGDEKIYIRFGDYIEEGELVAKSYYKTDKSQLRDSTCTDIWHEMRNFEPYPAEGVIPRAVLLDERLGMSRYKARATTMGTPTEIYVDGDFQGTYVLRSKKKRENYAMVKKDPNHILVQADYKGPGGYMSFKNMKLSSADVRNPKMSGYDDYDTTLPIPEVQTSVERIFDWMALALRDPVLFDTEGSEYINIDSWIDYSIFSELVRNWDGENNNYLIGTWDSKVWHVFAYDMDQSIGSYSLQPQTPYAMENILSELRSSNAPKTRQRYLERYRKMRNDGVISIENMTTILRSHFDRMNMTAFDENNKLWDVTMQEVHYLTFMVDWFYKRIRFLDAAFGYAPKGSIVMSAITVSSIAAGEDKSYSFNAPESKTTDVLDAETEQLEEGISYTVECVVDGTVIVTFTNNTDETLKPTPRLIRIYKVA